MINFRIDPKNLHTYKRPPIDLCKFEKKLKASAISLFLSFGNTTPLGENHPLVKIFAPNLSNNYFQNISNINDIKNIKSLLNEINNDNDRMGYAILFHDSVESLEKNLEIILKCMSDLNNRNVSCYNFVVENSIHTILQKSLKPMDIACDLLCNPIWQKKQRKIASSTGIFIYPYLKGPNPTYKRDMNVIKGLIFLDVWTYFREMNLGELYDITFVPQLRRLLLKSRCCRICGVNSHIVCKFYYKVPSPQSQEETFLCDKCYLKMGSPSSEQLVEFFDCMFEDTVKECFDPCYQQKKYREPLLTAKKLISLYSLSEHIDYENIMIFMFMKVKILKHKEDFENAIKCLTKCRESLNEITTQGTAFRTYFGIVLSYEEALLNKIAEKLEEAQTQFKKVKMDCQEFFKKQNQKFTGGTIILSHREQYIMKISCYARNFLAYIYRKQGQSDKALKSLLEIERCAKQFNIDDVIVVNACHHIGVIAHENNNFSRALTKLQKAEEMLRKCPSCAEHKEQKELDILQSIAEVYLKRNKFNEAKEIMQKPLKYANTRAADDNFRAFCWKLYGKILLKMGEYAKSIYFLNKSFAICDKYGFTIANEVLQLIGINFYELGRNNVAMKFYLNALEIAEGSKNELRIGDLNLSIGEILIKQNKFEDARKYIQSSIKTGNDLNNNLLVANGYRFLGILYYKKAKQMKPNETMNITSKQRASLQAALTNSQKFLDYCTLLKASTGTLPVLSQIGKIYAMLKQYNDAEASHKKSIAILFCYLNKKGYSHVTLLQMQVLFYEYINFYYKRVEILKNKTTEQNSNELKKCIPLCMKIMMIANHLENAIHAKQSFNQVTSTNYLKQCFKNFPENCTSLHYFICEKKKILLTALVVRGGIMSIVKKKNVDIKRIKAFKNIGTDTRFLANEQKWLGNLLFGDLKLPKEFTIFTPPRLISQIPFASLIVNGRRLGENHKIAVSEPSLK